MATLTRDGVRLVYAEAGSGSPPFLFVHGFSCDHEFFAPQVEHFGRAHRTVAVDLRGHGASDAPEQAYTPAAFADDLAWICAELRLERPVVVGHSMGATVALHLAAAHPELPRALVLIDGGTRSLAGPPISGDPQARFIDALRGDGDYQETGQAFLEPMFLRSTRPELRSWVSERMLSTRRHVMLSALEHLRAVDIAPVAAACRVPVLYVQAAAERPELTRLRELCPQLEVGRTVGGGHFNMLEAPEQVNAMIERFLALSEGQAAR